MIFRALLWMALLLPCLGLGQDGFWKDFDEALYEVSDRRRLEKIKEQSAELDRFHFSDIDGVAFNLTPDRQWRFMFAKRLGWEQVVFQEAEDLTAYYFSERMHPMTGKEITEMFGLNGAPEKVNPLNIVHFSNERFEEVFVLRAKNQPYAVVVYIHSYANGDMTSWFKEMRYYFVLE
jgi:hypothetical protein